MKKYIYILTFKNTNMNEYYTSLASMYLHHSKEDMGIGLPSLWNNKVDIDNPYENKLITIKKNIVISKPNSK